MAEKAARQKQAGRAADEAFMTDIQKLYDAYPETRTMERLPSEVTADFRRGLTPLEAYQKYALRQAENMRQAARGAQKAAAKSTGGAASQMNEDDPDVYAIFMANYNRD
jgi:hypothetical protein